MKFRRQMKLCKTELLRYISNISLKNRISLVTAVSYFYFLLDKTVDFRTVKNVLACKKP